MPDSWISRLMNFVGCAECRFLRAPRSTLASLTFWTRTRGFDEDQDGCRTPVPSTFSLALFPSSLPHFSVLVRLKTTCVPYETSRKFLSFFLLSLLLLFCATRVHTFRQSEQRNVASILLLVGNEMPTRAGNNSKFTDLLSPGINTPNGNRASTTTTTTTRLRGWYCMGTQVTGPSINSR